MKTNLFRLNSVRRFHRDTSGKAMIEIILILGAIAIPLLILLIAFGKNIAEWLKSGGTEVVNQSGDLQQQDMTINNGG